MTNHIPHFINGKLFEAITPHYKDVTNPASGQSIARVHFADQNICDSAIATAKKAGLAWSQTPLMKRARILFKFRELLEKHQHDIARLVTMEHGKTLDDAHGSVARAIELVEHHCGIVQQLQGTLSTEVATAIDCYTIRQPLGICFGVSPFNFPVMVPVWMIIPAIACGNSFILKPSEQDPSATLRLFELLTEAGLPDGVANCVQGDKNTVDYFLKHPDIQACVAVASTPVAEYIYQTAIAHGKRSHTFGGAKNHCIVMPDADLPLAAQAIVAAGYGSAGERCMAISVVVAVGDSTADSLIDALIPLIEAMRIGPGNQANIDMGPLVSDVSRQRVLAAIDAGVKEGATLLLDGRDYQHPECPNGFFLKPSLFDHVTDTMSVYSNEIFGPVLCVVRVKNLEDAITLINKHPYGNGTAIFTADGYTARYFSQSVNVGMVGINVPIPVPVASHPFGGWKRSVFGDTPMHGMESVHFYTRLKSVTTKWPAKAVESGHSFAMPTHI